MKHSGLGGNNYVLFVNGCTRFKGVTFVNNKSHTTTALFALITDYISLQELSVECIPTDESGKLEGDSRVN